MPTAGSVRRRMATAVTRTRMQKKSKKAWGRGVWGKTAANPLPFGGEQQ